MAIAADEVPFLDLSISTQQIEDGILEDVRGLLASNAFVNGPQVAEFEAEFAGYCGTSDCVAVASGLDALRLGLSALDLARGAEIIVPALTFVATWEAVSQAGAVPVPVDVTDTDYNIDVSAVEAAYSSRAAGVMPVHLYGQMADMASLTHLTRRRGLALVEDAAQAHGAERDGHRAGATGIASGFSFYPGKNLGAFGDAGALTTDDPEDPARVRALREHGQTSKYHHDEIGWTARMDTIQAAVLLRKLPHLDGWNDQRRQLAALYSDALGGVGDIRLPPVPNGSSPVWHRLRGPNR